MKNLKIFSFLNVVGFFLFLSACGRKQRDIFSFKEKEVVKIKALDFPAVHGISVMSVDHGNKILWCHINQEDLSDDQSFIGYNIYRLTNHGFIPKKPLNQIPFKNNEFLDNLKNKNKTRCAYLVHAVFEVRGKCLQGPASQIMWNK